MEEEIDWWKKKEIANFVHFAISGNCNSWLIIYFLSAKQVIIPKVEKVIEGHNLLVVCNATQTTDQEVFWVKNDSESHFLRNGTELRFVNINRKSSGVYMCYLRDTKSSSNGTVMELVNVDVLCKYALSHCLTGNMSTITLHYMCDAWRFNIPHMVHPLYTHEFFQLIWFSEI